MKKFIFILFISFLSLVGHSQIHGIPISGVYCFGNPEHKFISKLSPDSKIILSEIIFRKNIDTSKMYLVNYDEIFTKYASTSYLSSHEYTYIVWSKIDGKSSIKEFVSYNGYNTKPPDKLIILYNTNNQNIESLSFYILN